MSGPERYSMLELMRRTISNDTRFVYEQDYEAVVRERDEARAIFGEYAECLQDLCMKVLSERCRPVSHGWPGKKHIYSIQEGVHFLLRENEQLRALLDEAPHHENCELLRKWYVWKPKCNCYKSRLPRAGG